MKQLIPHLHMKDCEMALDFYQSIFGGDKKNIQLADDHAMFKGHEGKIIHAELHINQSSIIYFADVFRPITNGDNLWLSIELENEDDIKSIYDKLLENGVVKMELQETFWGSIYAVVTDKYGVTWELNVSM